MNGIKNEMNGVDVEICIISVSVRKEISYTRLDVMNIKFTIHRKQFKLGNVL